MLKRLYSLVMASIPSFLWRQEDVKQQEEGKRLGVMGLSSLLRTYLDGSSPEADRKRRRLEDGSEVVVGAAKDMLSEMPEECIREILGFLPQEDIWPSLACLSKAVSRAPAVVPALLSACPEEHRFRAMLAFVETSGCPAAISQVPRLHSYSGRVGTQSARRLARALDQGSFEGLQDLELSKAGMGAESVRVLAAALIHPTTYPAGRCPSLSHIDMSFNGMGAQGAKHLSAAIKGGACPRLQVLKLAGCGMGEAGTTALAAALASRRAGKLRHLDLSSNMLRAAAAESLCGPLGEGCCTALSDLLLGDNLLGEGGATALAAAIATGRVDRLTTLDLAGNRIREDGMRALADAWIRRAGELQHRTTAAPTPAARRQDRHHEGPALQMLGLARNELGDGGVRQLARLFDRPLLPELQALDLANNAITAEGLSALFGDAVARAGQPLSLRDLDVAGNRIGGGAAMEGLARASRRGLLLRLTRLNLDGCGIEAEGGLALAAALVPTERLAEGGWPDLHTLGLGCNRLTNQGVAALSEALKRGGAPRLARLTLSGNSMTDEGATALAAAVTQGACSQLTSLELFANEVQSDGLRRLAIAFRSRCKGLQVLDLGRPSLGPVGIQALGTYFLAAVLSEGALPALTHLSLGGNGVGRSGVYMLHIAMRNGACRHLTQLDLDGNHLGELGGAYLAIAFRRGGCPQLETLRLGGCALGDGGLNRIALAFQPQSRTARPLRVLNLANNAITAEGFELLSTRIRDGAFPSLESLLLDRNRAGRRGTAALASAFNTRTPGGLSRLRVLQLADNNVGDEGLFSLSWAMARAGPLALRSLVLAQNYVTGVGLASLCDALCSGATPHLQELGLTRNLLGGNQAGPQLARLLRSARLPWLSDLDVSSCQLDGEAVQQVVAVLSEGPASAACLTRVAMEGNPADVETTAAVVEFLEANGREGYCPVLTDCSV